MGKTCCTNPTSLDRYLTHLITVLTGISPTLKPVSCISSTEGTQKAIVKILCGGSSSNRGRCRGGYWVRGTVKVKGITSKTRSKNEMDPSWNVCLSTILSVVMHPRLIRFDHWWRQEPQQPKLKYLRDDDHPPQRQQIYQRQFKAESSRKPIVLS